MELLNRDILEVQCPGSADLVVVLMSRLWTSKLADSACWLFRPQRWTQASARDNAPSTT
jgi:hypothetical protein